MSFHIGFHVTHIIYHNKYYDNVHFELFDRRGIVNWRLIGLVELKLSDDPIKDNHKRFAFLYLLENLSKNLLKFFDIIDSISSKLKISE